MAAEALFHRSAAPAPMVVAKKRKLSVAVVGEDDPLPLIQAQKEVDRVPRVFRVEAELAPVSEGVNSAEAEQELCPTDAADRIIAWEQLEFPKIAEALRALER
jgi:hypothetical protein